MLHYAGQGVNSIYRTLKVNPAGEDGAVPVDKFADVTKKLSAHFNPKRNKYFEIHKFRQTAQLDGESLDAYVTRLRGLAQHCGFANPDSEIISQIIDRGSSKELTSKALRSGAEVTLAALMEWGRTREITELQVRNIAESQRTFEINAVGQTASGTATQGSCGNCGLRLPHRSTCPARGKPCLACGKPNHFANACRSARAGRSYSTSDNKSSAGFETSSAQRRKLLGNKAPDRVNQVKDMPEGKDYTFRLADSACKIPKVTIMISNKPVSFLVDTGSTIDVISRASFERLGLSVKLGAPQRKAFAFNSSEAIPIVGTFKTTLSIKNCKTSSELSVVDANVDNLLSFRTAADLGIIAIINSIQTNSLKEKFPNLFSGKIGKLKDFKLKFHVDPTVVPTKQQHFRIPFHLRQKVGEELDQLEADGLIEKVNGPTTWISPIHVVPKKQEGEIRIVVDARRVNKAIKRVRHITPTLDDLVVKLNGAAFFSKVDFNSGYRQVELDEESRELTTFSTHQGLYRDTRLSFGYCAAAEMFQYIVSNVLSGINGALNISDDIVVYGSTAEEHDRRLAQTLGRLEDSGLTANVEKCSFKKPEIEFFGVKFSKAGMAPCESRIESLENAGTPNSPSEVASFLGMASYSARFIRNFSTLADPLRELARLGKNEKFFWLERHQLAFEGLKRALKNESMAYFDPNRETKVIVDASPAGLGAVLIQTC